MLRVSDRWVCDLVSDGNFGLREIRYYIDDLFLPFQAARLDVKIQSLLSYNLRLASSARLFTGIELIDSQSINIESSLCSGLFRWWGLRSSWMVIVPRVAVWVSFDSFFPLYGQSYVGGSVLRFLCGFILERRNGSFLK
ncbi:hypothetical protein Tco_1372020 [Tanacetum coccineum]